MNTGQLQMVACILVNLLASHDMSILLHTHYDTLRMKNYSILSKSGTVLIFYAEVNQQLTKMF